MRELYILTPEGKKLHVAAWEPPGEIRAIVQISHGMIEYIRRYDHFAEYLKEAGILVIGNDHRGHGLTAEKDEDLGYFGEEKSALVVEDLHTVTRYAKEKYGTDKPYFLFGHSMGSFMARRYLMTWAEELDGAIICGTGCQPALILKAGQICAAVIEKHKGEGFRPEFLRKLAFGSYNKRIPDKRTENDWLTRDTEIVDAYNRDKYCTFSFTVNGYQTLFDVLEFIQKKENVEKIPKELPLYLIAGKEDPVGNYGKGVEKVFKTYKDCGIRDLKLKLYEMDRHEILNELEREDVYRDVKNWILERLDGEK